MTLLEAPPTTESYTWKPLTSRDVHPVNGAYVEHAWLPKLGPVAVLLLRRIPVLLSADPRAGDPFTGGGEPVYFDTEALAQDLGVGEERVLAARLRLTHFWLIGADSDGTWTFPAMVPAMRPAIRATLSPRLQAVEKALRG